LPLPSSDQVSREQSAVTENVLTVLTDREHQIMRLVSEGLSNKEIGRRLNLSDGTIKVHLHHIYQKLEISNRTVLAALAISQNEITGRPAEDQVPRIGANSPTTTTVDERVGPSSTPRGWKLYR
jgi:two-component system nitrate/nitrite response regulator NarL